MRRSISVSILMLFSLIPAAFAGYMDCPENPSGTHIRPENRFFDVIPRIVPANAEATVEIIPLFSHRHFKDSCTYELKYYPREQIAQKSGWKPKQVITITPENGHYNFKMFFEGEQEHIIYIEEICGDKRRAFGELHVYSLEPDLYALRPFKGDIHQHSSHSDGVESPPYVAGACRRAGLDFMALSDHKTYEGSIETQDAFKNLPIDLRIYPGEEVHPTDNPVHIVSFGASASISKFYQDDAAYRAEVSVYEQKLPQLPEGVNRFQAASCQWAFDKIRANGGLGMLCHIYWLAGQQFYISTPLIDYLFETQPFDAFELISGFESTSLYRCDTNNLQVARYQEERAKGKKIPVCGISDTHGDETSEAFGRYYTVCFAPSCDLSDLLASIKGLNSVAVEAVKGDLPRAYGPFRLVKYTLFLLREVFPQHDERCFEEGRLMIQYASGDTAALESLRLLQGQIQRLYAKYWK